MKDDDSMELEKRNEVTVEFLLQERWHLVLEIQQQAPPPFDGTPLQPQLCIASYGYFAYIFLLSFFSVLFFYNISNYNIHFMIIFYY